MSLSTDPRTRTSTNAIRRMRVRLRRALNLNRAFGTLSVLAALALAWSAWQWNAATRSASIAQIAAQAPVPEGAASAAARGDGDPRVLLPQASLLRSQGRHDDAVRILQALAARDDMAAPTAQVIRYNLANELLALALQSNTKGDEDRAMTLVELAKQRYREVLRLEPQHWDARHNLDIALRLAPENDAPPGGERPTNVQRIQVDLRGMRGVDLP